MDSPSPKLSLDLSPSWLVADPNKELEKRSELEDYVFRLEDELQKIKAFKRVLPLSVVLLNDAIQKLKKEVGRDGEDAKPVCNSDEILSEGSEKDGNGDKKSWMRCVQLWSSDETLSLQLNSNKPRDEQGKQTCEVTDNGGPELPPAKVPVVPRPELCLVTPEPATGLNKGGYRGSDQILTDQPKFQYQAPPEIPRKLRRCWSPELHRRFVDALDKLGGPHVATPKQIRELMQVNDLTNDEVKSHLQKYRLHIRKNPNSRTKLENSSKIEMNQFAMRTGNCSSPARRCDSMEDYYAEKSDSHSLEVES